MLRSFNFLSIAFLFIFSLMFTNCFAQDHQNHKNHQQKVRPKKLQQKDSATIDQPMKMDSSKTDEHKDHNQTEDHSKHNLAQDTSAGNLHIELNEKMLYGSMSHAFSRNLPMSRNGSGTAWLPDSSPVYGYMFHANNWMLMLHGNLFLRYTSTDIFNAGIRGKNKFSAPNWFMGMAQKPVGKRGLFSVRLMISLDPLTEGGAGYPLLYQSGESWKGKALVDAQHPHDFISELSIGYAHSFTKHFDASVYMGFPGEPAIGPTAFMHRPSALPNPDAGLGHHWQDATHITFGVVTGGIRYKKMKLEGSCFTGREPNENRFNFDKPRFDSYAARISYNPNGNLSLQTSYAFIKSPETLEPGEDVNRLTASVIHSGKISNKTINTSFVWGANVNMHGDLENTFLAESALEMKKYMLYGRYEFLQKSLHELNLEDKFPSTGEHFLFNINALTIGTHRNLVTAYKTNMALGAQITAHISPRPLQNLYGKMPVSAQVYFRFYPSKIAIHNSHEGHKH